MARIRRLHAITWGLLIFAAVNFFGVHAAIRVLAPEDFGITSAKYARTFLLGQGQDDSWKPMRAALEHLRQTQTEPVYQAVFFEQKIKFQYPPSSLLTLDLLDHLYRRNVTAYTLNRISWLCVFILAVVVPVTYVLALRKFNPAIASQFSTVDLGVQAITLSAMTLTFYPVTKGYYLGNIQTWLTCLFAGSVLAWLLGYEVIAGILIGLVITVKPQLVLLLLWGALRSRRRFSIACAATLALVMGISLWRYGLNNHINYLSVLSFLSAHGESYFANQSVNGILARMLRVGPNTAWLDTGFPPFHPVVYYGTLLTSALMIGFALFWRRTKKDEKSILISYLMTSLLITMASPVAWEHHYGLMISIYACFFAILLEPHPRAQWLIWTAVSYVLASNLFLFVNMAANTRWNFVQSYLFAAAALLIFTMYRHTVAAADPPAGGPVAVNR